MMSRFLTAALLVLSTSFASAQASVDDMRLSGVAVYEQLRQQFYIGGLYLMYPPQSPEDAVSMSGRKRMDIRVLTASWSPRNFAQQWNQLILINNPADQLDAMSREILQFTELAQGDLQAGDRLVVDLIPGEGTEVKLNGTVVMKTPREEFFTLLLNCWVGARPPSSIFKQNIVQVADNEEYSNMLMQFEITTPTQIRRRETDRWAQTQPSAAPATAAAAAPAAAAPQPGAADRAAEERARREAEELARQEAQARAAEEERARQEAVRRAIREAEARAALEAERKQRISEYSSEMVRSSYRNVRYPRRALNLNQQGTVLLEVVLNRRGELVEVDISQSSNHPALDQAAVEAIERTAPFGPIPEIIEGDEIRFTLPFTFQIAS